MRRRARSLQSLSQERLTGLSPGYKQVLPETAASVPGGFGIDCAQAQSTKPRPRAVGRAKKNATLRWHFFRLEIANLRGYLPSAAGLGGSRRWARVLSLLMRCITD